eukprot:TRINITY_DN1565_c0_g1_i8.p3 TRINITY_DN1565_c0_g1~~TRINITY_DN1565_c0_g1_i8.p3  ORF type:complete len:159 (-),score=46.77 TRINITY_DN1565_c0_g1_i8:894-1370(-)
MCIRDRVYTVQTDFHKDYITEKLLGRGSFSKVYNGYRRSKTKRVAVKTIRKSNMQENKSFFETTLNEMNILRLVKHPNIIKLYAVYESHKHVNFIFEYMEHGTLADYIRLKGDLLPPHTALKILARLMEILNYLHKMGIIHRDLKPENIFIQYQQPKK